MDQKQRKPPEKINEPKKRTILGSLFAREEPDKDYIADLRAQWKSMSQAERIKFIIGAILGLIIVAAMLFGVYLVIIAIR
jgi:hypothetical protein